MSEIYDFKVTEAYAYLDNGHTTVYLEYPENILVKRDEKA